MFTYPQTLLTPEAAGASLPEFVDAEFATQSTDTTSPITVTTPTAVAGDLMIAVYYSDDAADPDFGKVSGWDYQGLVTGTLDAEGHSVHLLARTATGSESANYAFNQGSSPSCRRIAAILVYRNVAQWCLDPHDGVTSTVDASDPLAGLSITTDRDNTLAVGIHCMRNTGNTQPTITSRASAYANNRVDMDSAGFAGAPGGMSMDINDEARPTAGATGTNELDVTPNSTEGICLTLGLVAESDPLMRFDSRGHDFVDGTGDVTVTFPTANLASGDMQVAVYYSNDGAAMNTPSGWTLEAEQTFSMDSETHRLALFRRSYSSGSSESFNQSGSPNARKFAWVASLKNATPKAFDVIQASTDAAGNVMTATGVTTGSANQLVFVAYGLRATNGAAKTVDVRSSCLGGGFQIRLDGPLDAQDGGGSSAMLLEIDSEFRPTAAATGSPAITVNDFGIDAVMYVFAIDA